MIWLFVLAFVIGAVVGSFLNVVASRVPRGESIVAPPSHCDACGRSLAPLELIPIASYLWLRGRCRTCRAPISRRVPAMEVAAGLIAAAALWLFGLTISTLLATLFAWSFLLLSVMDIEQHRVYNVVIVPALALAVLAAPWWPLSGLRGALIGAAVTTAPYALIYVLARRVYRQRKAMGLGDVKVAALMGLVTGWPGAIVALYAAILAGGLLGIVLVLTRRRARSDALAAVPLLAFGALIGVLAVANGPANLLRLISLFNL